MQKRRMMTKTSAIASMIPALVVYLGRWVATGSAETLVILTRGRLARSSTPVVLALCRKVLAKGTGSPSSILFTPGVDVTGVEVAGVGFSTSTSSARWVVLASDISKDFFAESTASLDCINLESSLETEAWSASNFGKTVGDDSTFAKPVDRG